MKHNFLSLQIHSIIFIQGKESLFLTRVVRLLWQRNSPYNPLYFSVSSPCRPLTRCPSTLSVGVCLHRAEFWLANTEIRFGTLLDKEELYEAINLT